MFESDRHRDLDADGARVGVEQPGDDPQQSRFAATGGTQDREKFARLDFEIEVFDDRVGLKNFAHAPQIQGDTAAGGADGVHTVAVVQWRSNASVRRAAIWLASRGSISRRCSMNTGLPS